MGSGWVYAAFVLSIGHCGAAIIVADGANNAQQFQQNQMQFTTMLNNYSQGGMFAINNGNLAFTANGAVLNNFATNVRDIVNSQTNTTLRINQSDAGVLVGAYRGGGTQDLDLADILAFPAQDRVLDLQSAVLLHEISEVFNSVTAGQGAAFPSQDFNNAHAFGIQQENGELTARRSDGQRGAGARFVAGVGGRGTIFFQWTDARDPKVASLRIDINNNAATQIQLSQIRTGLFDSGVSYDGTDYNISIDGISLADANDNLVTPEPGGLALVVIGLGGMLALKRNRRSRSC